MINENKLSPEIMKMIETRFPVTPFDKLAEKFSLSKSLEIQTFELGAQAAAIEGATIALTKQWVKVEDKAIAFALWVDDLTRRRQIGYISDWDKWRIWNNTELPLGFTGDLVSSQELFKVFISLPAAPNNNQK